MSHFESSSLGFQVTNIIMKTTGECLSAETIEAGGKTHTAFVFIKPHANTEKAEVRPEVCL